MTQPSVSLQLCSVVQRWARESVEGTKPFCRGPSEWGSSEARKVPWGISKGSSAVRERLRVAAQEVGRVNWVGPGGAWEGKLRRAFKHSGNTAQFLSEEQHFWQSVKDGMARCPHGWDATEELLSGPGWWPDVAGGGGEKSAEECRGTQCTEAAGLGKSCMPEVKEWKEGAQACQRDRGH